MITSTVATDRLTRLRISTRAVALCTCGLFVVVSAMLFLPDTTRAATQKTMFPVPTGISDAEHVVLSDNTVQDYFSVTAPFPSTPVLPHYERVFEQWTTCSPQRGWHVLGETPQMRNHYLHKYLRHWVSPDNTRAVTLLFQYWSPGSTIRIMPRNDTQMVSLVQSVVSDARSHFKAQGLNCAKQQ